VKEVVRWWWQGWESMEPVLARVVAVSVRRGAEVALEVMMHHASCIMDARCMMHDDA
jgi:hypothetical protein